MNEVRIRLDPRNPGQFWACCGLLELMGRRREQIRSRFEIRTDSPRSGEFVMEECEEAEILQVLADLRHAEYEAAVDGYEETAIQPVRAKIGGLELELDWWLDEYRSKATQLKCWGGQVTSLGLYQSLQKLLAGDPRIGEMFWASEQTKSKFGVDPRSAWNALDFGYSPNEHNQDAATYPMVEVLAAYGLQGFRPPSDTRTIAYSAWLVPLATSVARLAAFVPWDGLARVTYGFEIEKRGQGYKSFALAEAKGEKRYFA